MDLGSNDLPQIAQRDELGFPLKKRVTIPEEMPEGREENSTVRVQSPNPSKKAPPVE